GGVWAGVPHTQPASSSAEAKIDDRHAPWLAEKPRSDNVEVLVDALAAVRAQGILENPHLGRGELEHPREQRALNRRSDPERRRSDPEQRCPSLLPDNGVDF